MKLINREEYLEKVTSVIGTLDIKVITGVRRSGKSKLLEAFMAYIKANITNANIIHVNFNLPENEELAEYRGLYDYVKSKYAEGKENFVLIDEIQMCRDFEKAINGLHASEQFDIYITGSNAFLLSSDLATLFTGRTFEISEQRIWTMAQLLKTSLQLSYYAVDMKFISVFFTKKEVDFVAIKRNEKIYIQVSDNIDNPDTFVREVDSLLKIIDAYPKMIISRTKHDDYQYEGIKITDVANWLLQ